jgi:predicted amidohydrolase YtcJ
MFPAKPFSLMQTAILRTTSSGLAINPKEAIDSHQALRAMTINAAYQLRQDDQLGSLEPGKWADLVLLDGNPYEVPPTALDQLQVLQVYLAGRAMLGNK